MSEKQLKEFLETIERVRQVNPSPEQKPGAPRVAVTREVLLLRPLL
jgi:hypothetical protein